MMTDRAATTASTSSWLVRLGRCEQPRVRLVCAPYAGAGTAAYREWPAELPPWVEVWAIRLPARESRIGEPPVTDMRVLVDAITAEIVGITEEAGVPYALYGHSMGAALAFELARALSEGGSLAPAHLLVSGRRAPHIPDDLPHCHTLPPPQFLDRVRALGGIPDEILGEPGLVDLVLPAMAADFAVVETYDHVPDLPVPCGITAFGGDRDPTTSRDQLTAWERHTSGPFALRILAGDHFFVNSRRGELLAAVTADLMAALAIHAVS